MTMITMTFFIGASMLIAMAIVFLFGEQKKPDEDADLRGSKKFVPVTKHKIFDDEAFDTFTDDFPVMPKRITMDFIAPDAEILIVDADEKILLDATNMLKVTQVKIDTATRGIFCLQKLTRKHYDLIFLARTLPVLDGIQTLELSLALEENLCKETPTIALTTSTESTTRATLLAKGFTDCISKPLDAELLREMLMDYLPIKKLRLPPAVDAAKESDS